MAALENAELLRYVRSELRPARVMALVVHPYIMGAPHRLKYLRKALQRIRQHDDVLFWTGEQIVDWYLSQRPERPATPDP